MDRSCQPAASEIGAITWFVFVDTESRGPLIAGCLVERLFASGVKGLWHGID